MLIIIESYSVYKFGNKKHKEWIKIA